MRVYIGTPAPVTASTTTTFSPPTAGVGLVNPLNGTTNFNAWKGKITFSQHGTVFQKFFLVNTRVQHNESTFCGLIMT